VCDNAIRQSVDVAPNLPFKVSVLTDVAMATVAGAKIITLPSSISNVLAHRLQKMQPSDGKG
jgi:hypothetical protein